LAHVSEKAQGVHRYRIVVEPAAAQTLREGLTAQTRDLMRRVSRRQEILPSGNARTVVEALRKLLGGKSDASHDVNHGANDFISPVVEITEVSGEVEGCATDFAWV
jgi:hypothetical protein